MTADVADVLPPTREVMTSVAYETAPLTIYVAGSSRDLPRAQAAMDLALELGFELTYDWVEGIGLAGGRANEGLPPIIAEAVSHICLGAAVRADVMWLLLDPEHRSPGAHVELGGRLALCSTRGLYLTGPRPDASIHYAGATYAGLDDAAMRPHLLGLSLARRAL